MTPTSADDRNAEQIAYWNGPAGQRWVQRQQEQDALLAPVAEVLLERAAPRAGDFVLDIGCGWGGTAIALAGRVAPGGRVLGVDVSEPAASDRLRQGGKKSVPPRCRAYPRRMPRR